jgi:hypothetical protein
MKRRLIQFIQNVDALVPLILGVAVSVLGLLDLASARIVDSEDAQGTRHRQSLR